jgi:hypothetical protein
MKAEELGPACFLADIKLQIVSVLTRPIVTYIRVLFVPQDSIPNSLNWKIDQVMFPPSINMKLI